MAPTAPPKINSTIYARIKCLGQLITSP
jgi:hypothetical protein